MPLQQFVQAAHKWRIVLRESDLRATERCVVIDGWFVVATSSRGSDRDFDSEHNREAHTQADAASYVRMRHSCVPVSIDAPGSLKKNIEGLVCLLRAI